MEGLDHLAELRNFLTTPLLKSVKHIISLLPQSDLPVPDMMEMKLYLFHGGIAVHNLPRWCSRGDVALLTAENLHFAQVAQAL